MLCYDCRCEYYTPCGYAEMAYFAGLVFALLLIPVVVGVWSHVKPRPMRRLRNYATFACAAIIYNACEPCLVPEATDWTTIIPTVVFAGCLTAEVVHELVSRRRDRLPPVAVVVPR